MLAVVVTHHGRSWLKDCLVALEAQTYDRLDVLVVDDASTDYRRQPHLKRVVKRHVRKRRWGYLRTPRAMGFGGAINWALARVRTDVELLLFVHDDAALDPTGVENMVRRLESDPGTGIVGPKIVSWNDTDRLEEVGMAVDRLGYPYKGLEEDEIDLGQHDTAAEVFYVTSTCMLVRQEVFGDLKGWDTSMKAFSEDLDLCWRARLKGHAVRVEPGAKARHAIALATNIRQSPFRPPRYYIRRNRLRALIKNSSGLHLISVLPLFILLSFAEMLGFVLLRQPREILNLLRALAWNLFALPQTVALRVRVQRSRKVSDRALRRLRVRGSTRLRAYVTNQAGRLEEAWGRRAEFVSERGAQARAMSRRLSGWPAAIALACVVAIVLGFRHFLWGPQAAVGELLPFPERATALWRALLSPWRDTGLGEPGPAPPAFAFLGALPVLALGAAGAAQKLLLLVAGVAAATGAYRLVAPLVDRPARLVAALAYVFGPLGYAAVRHGAVGAMALGAAAPFALLSLLRFAGWVRPAGWSAGHETARLALAVAVASAFAPGSLFVHAILAVVLFGARALVDQRAPGRRDPLLALAGLVLGWALLAPWSTSWWSEGGPLERLRGDGWERAAASYRGHGIASVLAGQTPDGPLLVGLALALLGVLALAIGDGQRRRAALALWAVVVFAGWLVGATATGTIKPLLATPTEAGVFPALAFAGLAGVAVGAFRLDLPRRRLGRLHALALGGFLAAGLLFGAGIGPTLLQGEWAPQRGPGRLDEEVLEQVTTVLGAEVEQRGDFRILWVGDAWRAAADGAAGDHMISGPAGPQIGDLYARADGFGEGHLRATVAAIEQGTTSRGGALLEAFNVDFVVLERTSGAGRWLAQRDLAVARSEAAYFVLENRSELDHAAVYERVPPEVEALERPEALADPAVDVELRAERDRAWRYSAPGAEGPGVAFLAEAPHEGWSASLGGDALERVEAPWGNAFELPDGSSGELTLAYPRPGRFWVWLAVVLVAWIVVGGAAFSRIRPTVARTHP